MADTICTCAMHCPESGYHERACCSRLDCDCWCHGLFRVDYKDRDGRERFQRFHHECDAATFADRNSGLLTRR